MGAFVSSLMERNVTTENGTADVWLLKRGGGILDEKGGF